MKSKLISIVAMSSNFVIGNDNEIMWHISEDFARFKQKTMGRPIIMGRKTLESLPKLLPGRLHLVLTHKLDYAVHNKNVKIFNSIEVLMDYLNEYVSTDVYVIGGSEIYELFEPIIDSIEVTKIEKYYEGDTKYVPNLKNFKLVDVVKQMVIEKKSKEKLMINFYTYNRIKN